MSCERVLLLQTTASSLLEVDPRETERLCWALGLTREKIIEAYVKYHFGVDTEMNDVFNSVALRYAMYLSNRIPRSWHGVRQEIAARRIKLTAAKRIVDVGFGIPQRYVREAIFRGSLRAETVSVHLLDFGYSSMAYGQALLSLWNEAWSQVVRLRSFDMEKGGYVGDYDCYVFQDSIEHVTNPTRYLHELVSLAPGSAHFVFSLPIEVVKVMPQHFISWKDADEVGRWLESSGLTILFREEILIDRSVDIYAQKLHPEYRQVVFHCQKLP